MKNLIEIINEKLLISKNTQKQVIDKNTHELTPDEFVDALKYHNIGDNICKIYFIDYKGNKTKYYPQFKSQDVLGTMTEEPVKNWNIWIIRNKSEGEITGWDLISNNFNGKPIKRIIFGETWDTNPTYFAYKYFPIKIEEDPNDKDIVNIYITNNKELKAIQAADKSDKSNADPNYFEPANEANVLKQIDSKYKADQIPQDEKYKGKNNPKSKLFWCIWATLAIYGKMRREEIIQKINDLTGRDLMLTSYNMMFMEWERYNRIQKQRGIYEAVPYDKWY